jgi:hypothetical protein
VLPGIYRAHRPIIIASKNPKISKQVTANKRKHVTLIIPYKCEIIGRLEGGEG